jgi:choline dehydrogenase-like flavoprotein
MAGFDYDVVIVGSGFGGSVASLRAAEKGYRVGVLEAGRRWKDEDIPKTQWDLPHFLGSPQQSCTGSRGSSLSTMCSSFRARVSGAARMSMRTRCMSLPSSSSMRRNGRASPTGRTNWRRASIRQLGCSA